MGRWAVIREDTLGTVNLFDQHCAENLGIDRPSQRPGATKTHLPRPAQRLERIIIHARDVRFIRKFANRSAVKPSPVRA